MAADGITLRDGRLQLGLDRRGAIISGARWRKADGTVAPVMRDGAAHGGDPLKASCFPLLPFGSRVRDNRFTFGGQDFALAPNVAWDRHYLHGDGWLTRWNLLAETESEASFAMRHEAGPSGPYAYASTIVYRLRDDELSVMLTLRNESVYALPFGLGMHPYFPLTPGTTMQAAAAGCFAEAADFLPGPSGCVPAALDFSSPRRLPRRWINNGFTGWDGRAEIVWPEHDLALTITASAAFRNYVVFMPDTRFEPGFAHNYFCFEPMTHQANAHHAENFGGLVVLEPGETLAGDVSFQPHDHRPPSGSTL